SPFRCPRDPPLVFLLLSSPAGSYAHLDDGTRGNLPSPLGNCNVRCNCSPVVGRIKASLGESTAAFRDVFANPDLRRLEPAQAALLPSLARTPTELTAANVTSSTIESLGLFVGPAIGGVLLAVTSAGVVFLATAGAALLSALLIARITAPHVVERGRVREG